MFYNSYTPSILYLITFLTNSVKVYNSKCDSVKDYIRIINTVFAYEEFRELRDQNADVYELVDTLDRYATKQTYTELVKKVIKYNIEGVYEL